MQIKFLKSFAALLVTGFALAIVPWAVLAQTTPEASPEATQAVLTQVQQLFPEQVFALQAECPSPNTLNVDASSDPTRASFICWSAPASDGSRTGEALGTLPLSENDTTFVEPLSCVAGDRTCEAYSPTLRSRYTEQLQQAEFQCAVKGGHLFLTESAATVNVRCGFVATTLWDNNGDGRADNQDPVSVDILIGTFPKS